MLVAESNSACRWTCRNGKAALVSVYVDASAELTRRPQDDVNLCYMCVAIMSSPYVMMIDKARARSLTGL